MSCPPQALAPVGEVYCCRFSHLAFNGSLSADHLGALTYSTHAVFRTSIESVLLKTASIIGHSQLYLRAFAFQGQLCILRLGVIGNVRKHLLCNSINTLCQFHRNIIQMAWVILPR